ncbi:insulinase family protein, partial [Xanthomonas citri pv. citri]|nr:insulinase family protein [Xanthomonas citri pv. citri]
MRIILTSLVLFAASTTSYAEKSEPIQGQFENGLRYTLLPLHSEKGRIEIRMK